MLTPPSPRPPREALRLLAEMAEAEDWSIGDRLPPEIELARRLGLGRSTLREALRQWESLGIIRRNKGAGTRLTAAVGTRSLHLPLTVKIEADSLARMLEVRRPLEVESARLAALRADPDQRAAIAASAEVLLAVHASGADWREADRAFHAAIHEASGNPLFAPLISQIHRGFHDIWEAPFGEPQLGHDTIPMHGPLSDAVVAGHAERAAAVMAEILDAVMTAARRHVEGAA